MARFPSQAPDPTPFYAAQPPPRRFTTKVVGVTFTPGYPDNLVAVERAWYDRMLTMPDGVDPEPIPVVLVANPDNEVDPNAVEVHVPAVGLVGHLPRHLAARLSPNLLDGEPWEAGVEVVATHPDHPDRPGLSVHVHRVTME